MSLFKVPAILCIFVISSASVKLKSGSIVGNLLANIVLPEPGLPIKRQLCEPAAETSSALFIFS